MFQVKGVNYDLFQFLGDNAWCSKNGDGDHRKPESLLQNKNNKLYQCTIYLAPGDYHRYVITDMTSSLIRFGVNRLVRLLYDTL